MSARDPFSRNYETEASNAGLVDKMIGTAYATVRAVALALAEVKFVAANIDWIKAAAGNRLDGMITGTTAARGTAKLIPLPIEIAAPSKIVLNSVTILGDDGTLYTGDSGVFTAKIGVTGLSVTLLSTAPAELEDCQIRWVFSYAGA